MSLQDLLFVGFNGRVVALAQRTGGLVWEWKCPKPSKQMMAVLVQGDRIFASSEGYTYCLDALSGVELWDNPLKGLGTGVPCLATAESGSSGSFLLHAQTLANQQAAAASHGSGAPHGAAGAGG